MVSNRGPEEDSTIGVWKSLLDWECRARGSTQWSAPETASGPSCRTPKCSRWPNKAILPNHGFTSLTLITESYTVKRGSSYLRTFQSSRHTGKGDLICCALSVVTEFSCILKQGYLNQTHQQKQKPQVFSISPFTNRSRPDVENWNDKTW